MTTLKTTGIVLGAVVLLVLYFVFLAGGKNQYSDTDTSELDRAQLFRIAEALLEESEAWPAELTADGVAVASSLEPYPARTVRYEVEVNAPFEKVIEYVKDENYSGPGRRDKPEKDKYEVTLYQKDRNGRPYEWVRRSVHISPPPGGNRDAVVMYFEDRPDPKTYRIAFQSVETIEGKDFPEVEGGIPLRRIHPPKAAGTRDVGIAPRKIAPTWIECSIGILGNKDTSNWARPKGKRGHGGPHWVRRRSSPCWPAS